MKLQGLLMVPCTLEKNPWYLFNYTENETLWTTAPLACGPTTKTDPAQHHLRVTMIRAQPKPTHCKSLRILSSSSTFDLGSALIYLFVYLFISCVLTKLKQEASWTGNLCKHLADTKHSDRGGDTFWKRERDAHTPTCLPQSTIKGSFCNITVQFMALLFSHRRTLHLLSPGRGSSLPGP